MKKFQHIFAALALAILSSSGIFASAQNHTSGDFIYSVDNMQIGSTLTRVATIVGYTGSEEVVTIPDSLDRYKVRQIGQSAFADNSYIKQVNICRNILNIGAYAFSNSSLQNINIPANVNQIGRYAFYNCTDLSRVNIEDSEESIHIYYDAFSDDSVHTPFTGDDIDYFYVGRNLLPTNADFEYSTAIPCSTMILGDKVTTYTFSPYLHVSPQRVRGNKPVTKNKLITLNNGLKVLTGAGGTINISYLGTWNSWKNSELCYFASSYGEGNSGDASYKEIVKDGIFIYILNNNGNTCSIVDIDVNSLQYQQIIVPQYATINGTQYRVISIEESACYRRDFPFSIVLPEECVTIGAKSFYGCTNLSEINLNMSSLRTISANAFTGCDKLSEVELGENVTSITKAFYDCKGLKSIKLDNKLSTIGNSTFYNCSKLQKVELGSKLTAISDSAFCGCVSLKDINFNTYKRIINFGSYSFKSTSLRELSLDYHIKLIGKFAFSESSIMNVAFYDSVDSLAENAFSGATIGSFDMRKINSISTDILKDAKIDSLYLGGPVSVFSTTNSIGTPKSLKYLCIASDFTNLYNVFASTTDITMIESHNLVPPDRAEFANSVYNSATVSVPAESLSAYKSAFLWRNFYNIVASSGVNDVVRDADSWSGDDSYYDLQGRKVANPQQGIYIHHGQKVIVK